MTRSRRASLVFGGLLALALAALIFILARGTPQSAPDSTGRDFSTRPPEVSVTPQSAEGALAPLPTVDPTLAAIVRPSLPEEWAAAVTDRATQHLSRASQTTGADFAWLPENGLVGPLTQTVSGIAIGGQSVSPNERTAIEVALPEESQPGGLLSLARIEWQDNTLTLRLTDPGTGGQSVRSLSYGVQPGDVLATLIEEAGARDVVLKVAYWEMPGGSATLVLVEVLPAVQETPPAAPTSTPGTPPPTPTLTPTLTYEMDIRRAVEAGLQPFLEASPRSPDARRHALTHSEQTHAWVGTLTWDADTGEAQVAGHPLRLNESEARRLVLFDLTDDDMAQMLLQADWDGNGTTIVVAVSEAASPAEQWYYGFRLSEVAHWLVILAEERGGQLTIAYDDIGSYRAITLLDFQPLPLPPGI